MAMEGACVLTGWSPIWPAADRAVDEAPAAALDTSLRLLPQKDAPPRASGVREDTLAARKKPPRLATTWISAALLLAPADKKPIRQPLAAALAMGTRASAKAPPLRTLINLTHNVASRAPVFDRRKQALLKHEATPRLTQGTTGPLGPAGQPWTSNRLLIARSTDSCESDAPGLSRHAILGRRPRTPPLSVRVPSLFPSHKPSSVQSAKEMAL